MALNAASMPPPQNEVSEEQLRTLWVGGISDRVDEETLYELFINASTEHHSVVTLLHFRQAPSLSNSSL